MRKLVAARFGGVAYISVCTGAGGRPTGWGKIEFSSEEYAESPENAVGTVGKA